MLHANDCRPLLVLCGLKMMMWAVLGEFAVYMRVHKLKGAQVLIGARDHKYTGTRLHKLHGCAGLGSRVHDFVGRFEVSMTCDETYSGFNVTINLRLNDAQWTDECKSNSNSVEAVAQMFQIHSDK